MSTSIELVVEILIFCAVVLMSIGVAHEVGRLLNQRRRLGGEGTPGSLAAIPLLTERVGQNNFFQWIQSSTSISDMQERHKLRRALSMAGFDNPNAVIWYVIGRFSLAIMLPVIFLLLQSVSSRPMTGLALVFWPLVLCGAGLLIPGRILASRANARQTRLECEFPDALDLMVVCVEAGLSLDSSFIRVGNEIGKSHPRIAEEFAKVSEQLRAGRARADALRAMADRTGVNAVKSFVALLIQTELLGSSVAQTLRTFSTEMRETRFLRAEEKAMRIPVVMTIPLVACILPVIVTAALLPAMIDIVRTVLPALMGSHG
jgi:tight adherence protein C